MPLPLRWAAALLALSAPLGAYVRSTTTRSIDGPPLFRGDAEAISFRVGDNVAPGLLNADGRLFIRADSDPVAALGAALQSWNGIPTSLLKFNPLSTTPARRDRADGLSVFVFDDNPDIRAATLGALAVTLAMFTDAGEILDTDIVFNPNVRIGNNQVPFSTNLDLNTFDVQAVATHESGHAIGLNHTPVVGAAMAPRAGPSENFQANISTDEIAFATDVYPAPGADADLGTIAGTITAGGKPVTGAAVTAIDPLTGVVISMITDLADGSFRIHVPATPTGRYFVYVEPLDPEDGPLFPTDIQIINTGRFHTGIRTRFLGGNAAPRRLDVFPDREMRADFVVEEGITALEIERIGTGEPGGVAKPRRFTAGPIRLFAGERADILLAGPGLDESVAPEDIRLLAPGIRIEPGSVRVDPVLRTLEGGPVLRMTVEVDPRPTRQIGTIAVIKGAAATVYTGAMVIEPSPAAPKFTAEAVVNAANFIGGGVAPGVIATIFGTALGPDPFVLNTGFDPESGCLPSELGGVVVTFDGIPAPMFFAFATQLNLQVPVELAGRSTTTIAVTYRGRSSDPVTVPVLAAHPGIFTVSGGLQAVVLNQDGSLNGPGNRAARGDVLTFYATGPGLLDIPIGTGKPALADPLSRAQDVTVVIGGVRVAPEDILFAGMTPGFVGLLQINVRIPASVAPGDTVVVVISIRGVSGPPRATIAVE